MYEKKYGHYLNTFWIQNDKKYASKYWIDAEFSICILGFSTHEIKITPLDRSIYYDNHEKKSIKFEHEPRNDGNLKKGPVLYIFV